MRAEPSGERNREVARFEMDSHSMLPGPVSSRTPCATAAFECQDEVPGLRLLMVNPSLGLSPGLVSLTDKYWDDKHSQRQGCQPRSYEL